MAASNLSSGPSPWAGLMISTSGMSSWAPIRHAHVLQRVENCRADPIAQAPKEMSRGFGVLCRQSEVMKGKPPFVRRRKPAHRHHPIRIGHRQIGPIPLPTDRQQEQADAVLQPLRRNPVGPIGLAPWRRARRRRRTERQPHADPGRNRQVERHVRPARRPARRDAEDLLDDRCRLPQVGEWKKIIEKLMSSESQDHAGERHWPAARRPPMLRLPRGAGSTLVCPRRLRLVTMSAVTETKTPCTRPKTRKLGVRPCHKPIMTMFSMMHKIEPRSGQVPQ